MRVSRRELVKASLVLAVGAPVVALARQDYDYAPAGTPAASPMASSAGSPAATPAGGVTIDIINFAFEPPSLSVPAGTTVTWVNTSSTIHNTVAEDESWQSEVLDPGESFSFQVTQPGTYAYLCTIHPNMKAELTVE